MKNYIQGDESVVAIAPYDVASGEFCVAAGNLYGVAVNAALNGAEVVLKREGVYELAKLAGTAWVQGDVLYWDVAAKKFTKVAAGNKQLGVAFADAAAGDVTGQVSIEEVPGGIVNAVAGVGAGYKIARGQAVTVAASDTIVTGLATVVAAVANLEDAPVIGCDRAQALIGDQAGAPAAGSIKINTYKPTGAGDATPIAATTFGKKVNWIAVGT